jgi:ABC-type antimicrobial peptide transport system permease subunit
MGQLLTEGLVLALVGGCVGIVLAMSATHVITTIAPTEIPRLGEVELNLRVLLYALTVSSLSGVAVGLVVAVRVAGTHQIGSLTLDNSGTTHPNPACNSGFATSP